MKDQEEPFMKRLSTIFLADLLLAGLFPAAAVGEDA